MAPVTRLCPEPSCLQAHLSVPRALACWLTHRPHLREELGVASMAERLGCTPGRITQAFHALGIYEKKPSTPREPR